MFCIIKGRNSWKNYLWVVWDFVIGCYINCALLCTQYYIHINADKGLNVKQN